MKRALLKIGGVGWAIGNLGILAAHRLAASQAPAPPAPWGATIANAHEVDATVWRSAGPDRATYAAVAAAGATAVVDLRAEGGDRPDPALGLDHISLPIRDGQAPDEGTLQRWLQLSAEADGPLLVHCSAGVGRTGSLVAAHQVIHHGRDPWAALGSMLAVGPPSLEQIDFVLGLPDRTRPRPAMVALSRALDAPRRAWSRLRAWRG